MVSKAFKEVDSKLASLILVVGVDGSGKSTFMKNLSEHTEALILEPSTAQEARDFKIQHLNTPIDENFINEREDLFLGLNSEYDQKSILELEAGHNVITSGSRLITKVSHGLMRAVILTQTDTIDAIVGEWLTSQESLKPDEIVFVHASDEVILRRIKKRQARGMGSEKFWGFNSPYFLSRYQNTWHNVISILAQETTLSCVSLDNSVITPEMTIASYNEKLSK